MIKNRSLKMQLLVSIYSIIIIGIVSIFYITDSNLKEEINKSKHDLYSEKIDNIIYLIDQKYEKLLQTQMKESYEKSFKEGTLKIIEKVFDKKSEDLYPIIVDENREIVIHRDFNNKSRTDFNLIVKMKSGELDIFNEEKKWVIFKYYEPWDWIVGYVIPHSVKYKELYQFREIFFVTAILILTFIYFLILYVIKNILVPVESLTDITKKIALGDYKTSINISGVKELTLLAENFEYMRNQINIEMDALLKSEREIDSLNKNLLVIVDERTKELKEQKEVFETLFRDSKDGLCLVEDGKFIDCNDTLLRMLKFDKKEDFIGLTPTDLSPQFQLDGSLSKEAVKANIDKCLKYGSARFEWVHKKATGEEFWAEIVITKVIINNKIVIFSAWRDISDKKELEVQLHNRNLDLQDSNDELETMIENLRETQNKLVESEKLAGLGSMVAGVAHEINTPVGIGLTGSSHLEFLSESISEKYNENIMSQEDFEEYIKSCLELSKVINSNLNRTAEIIKNFKQVAIDQTSEQKRVFNLKEYTRGVLVSIDSLKKDKEINFLIDCDDKLEIISYPGFFAHIITNFVSNSITHGFKNKKQGNISFSIKRVDDELYFVYKDDGIGISKENQMKIYEPFFSTNKKESSSGLGMNIVYNLVTVNLKGTIDCESELNNGVTFTIRIPL